MATLKTTYLAEKKAYLQLTLICGGKKTEIKYNVLKYKEIQQKYGNAKCQILSLKRNIHIWKIILEKIEDSLNNFGNPSVWIFYHRISSSVRLLGNPGYTLKIALTSSSNDKYATIVNGIIGQSSCASKCIVFNFYVIF